MTEFKKFDIGKPDMSYILEFPDVMAGFCRVMTHGEMKYGRENFKLGEGDEVVARRYYAAVMRHILAHYSGELIDPESGESHLSHAIAGLVIIHRLTEKGNGNSERSSKSIDARYDPHDD